MGPEMCITDDSAAERAAEQYGQQQFFYYAFFTTCKVGGLGCGTQSMELH